MADSDQDAQAAKAKELFGLARELRNALWKCDHQRGHGPDLACMQCVVEWAHGRGLRPKNKKHCQQ